VTNFHFEAHAEGTTSPWEMQKQRVMSAMAATIVRNFHMMSPKVKVIARNNTTATAATIMRNCHTKANSRNILRQRPQRLCRIHTKATKLAQHTMATAATIVRNLDGDQTHTTKTCATHTTATAATIMRNCHTKATKLAPRNTLRQRPQRLCGIFAR